MQVSLNAFLRTGNLGELRNGMSKTEVRALLGEPDAVGGESRKYRKPSIFLYGTAELHFDQQAPHCLTSFWWEAGEKGEFRLSPVCEILDWAFTPDWTFAQVDDYLDAHDLLREYPESPSYDETMSSLIVRESGVRISFHDGKLYGIWR